MTAFEELALRETPEGHREAVCDGRRWITRCLVLRAAETPVEVRTAGDEESGVLVLSGTHDLEAGAGSWISRGTRASPFEGRPVALFLPPNTPFRSSGGAGDLLIVSARRPELRAAEPEPEPESKPLLPLAGSNKAFDHASGSWQPIESFPDSPEAILPRRIERHTVGDVALELVFPVDYKTRGLVLTEAVVEADRTLTLPEPGSAADGYPEEWAIYYRAEGRLHATGLSGDMALSGEGVIAGSGEVRVQASGGPAYLAIVYAGAKPA